YGTDGTGTITLNTDTNGTVGTVTVSGLTDKFINGASLSGNTLTITRNDGEKFTVDKIATTDDITGENSIVNMKFAGDDGTEITKKNGETLKVVGGVDEDKLTATDNIGVVEDNGNLKVKLAKDLTGIDSARIGGTVTNGVASGGIYIANQTGVKNTMGKTEEDGLYITGLTNTTWNPKANGFVSGRAATEDQLNSVYETINSSIEANKVTGSKNITVSEDNKVSLNDNITLGGDMAANQVNINGNDAKITAGDGANKVVVDGANGQVTIGDTANGGIVMGNQTVEGTKSDNTKDSQSGKFLAGLDNTKWDPENQGVVENRAATEGQLKDIADQISDIDTAVKSSSRVFESDSGSDAGSLVTVKNTDPMKLKGGATGELSDGNIGVVNNSDKTGFDIKLSKDIKGLNSIEVNNKITIGTGDNQTIIEGDTINTGSVTTGNTTINNNGLTIVNEDSSKNITINNNNVNMGGNVIKNIGEGSEPTDAINKTQFDRAINNLGTGMNQINNRVNKLDNRVNRVGAGAAALAALHPLEFSPDAKWEVTAGVGNYRGANAIALGAFYRPNFDTMFSIGTSYGGGENMINAGVTWRIGEGETKAYPSKTVMAQEIDDLKNVVSEQQDQIEELKKLVNSLINK
uniref:YadA-like family protein n=1 Tax=uncultured Megasphaera sp. TaxID=165188 RepID=UPI0025EECC7C